MTTVLTLPEVMTPAISEALGMMNFSTGPIARALRAGGHSIPERCEDEQAYVLFWFLKLAIEHGENWKKPVGEELERIAAAAR